MGRRALSVGVVATTLGMALACSGAVQNETVAPLEAAGPGTQEKLDRSTWQWVGQGDQHVFASWEVAYAVTEPAPAHAVVLFGSRDPKETWRWMEQYVSIGAPARPKSAYPFVVDSGDLQGMNPGFTVIVAATPAREEQANAIRDWYRDMHVQGLDLTGVYVKPIVFPMPEEDVTVEDLIAGE